MRTIIMREWDIIECSVQDNLPLTNPNKAGMTSDPPDQHTNTAYSEHSLARRSPDFPNSLTFSKSFPSSSPISFSQSQLYHHH